MPMLAHLQATSGRRVRRRARGGVRLGLLLRLRVRLAGVVGLLVRGVEGLRCCRPRGNRIGCSSAAAALPPPCRHGGRWRGRQARPSAPAAKDYQSSFYAEAIADCLEFIKSRSCDLPAKDDKITLS